MTENRLRIVIVGGVAGGASAATRARRMNENAEIVLFEKDSHVSFANCGLPYYIGGEIEQRDSLLVTKPELLRKRFRIDVRTRHEVTGLDRARRVVTVVDREGGRTFEQPYDRLIISTGARPIRPALAGMDADNVFTLRNVEDTDRIKEYLARPGRPGRNGGEPARAVVVGAGFIGVEMVEQLSRLGMRVTLVELADQILPAFDPEMAAFVQEEIESRRVAVKTGCGLKDLQVENGTVARVELADGSLLDADLVLIGVGVQPNTELAGRAGLKLGKSGGIAVNEFHQTSDPDVYAVGDAAEYVFGPTGAALRVALAGPANRSGRIAGEHAATGTSRTSMAPVFGTAIVRAFDCAAAVTGLTAREAARQGENAATVIVPPFHHANYYPGAKRLVLKLVFDMESGRVLGAQAVGAEGVDKRIDVIATAMRFGATVRDLADLDLAYAPPFNAARDPIHHAAYTAQNHLDGLMGVVLPDAHFNGSQVVDVRFDDEVKADALAGAIHIPLDELRDRIGELDPERPTVMVCAIGQRGYVGSRILAQHGFRDVSILTGGMYLLRRAER